MEDRVSLGDKNCIEEIFKSAQEWLSYIHCKNKKIVCFS